MKEYKELIDVWEKFAYPDIPDDEACPNKLALEAYRERGFPRNPITKTKVRWEDWKKYGRI